MKRSLLAGLAFLLAPPPADAVSNSTGFMFVPGVYRGGGYDLTLLFYEQQQFAFGFAGINAGKTDRYGEAKFAELEVGGSGWGIGSLVLGVGHYEKGELSGLQGTFSLQFWTPFLGYMRAREFETKRDGNWFSGIEYGLVWKLPIPIAENYKGTWQWGMRDLVSSSGD